MTDYTDIAQLRDYVLEESWVLGITATPGQLEIDVDLVFAKDHPDLRPPRAGDALYSQIGSISFREVMMLEWHGQGRTPATDAAGEADWGGIDAFQFEGAEYRLEGDWGIIRVVAKALDVVLRSAS